VQRPQTCGASGWPADPTLQPLGLVSLAVTLSKRRWNGTRDLESVEVMLDGRPATWLGQPANTWRITDLIKSVTTPGTPINTSLPMEFNTTHSSCSSPLVKVPV
jgi:hypothetical protein